ncbi:MAG: hypothetical protein ABI140_08910 [Jatrophihabitantaceae bacterium]
MTEADPNPLYELVPRLYQLRDTELGYPLRTLLAAVSEQYLELLGDVDRLYDDWFIETCQPDRIRQFAALLGVQLSSRPASFGADLAAAADRRQVANALADRAGKGSLAAIEKLAQDVTGWPVRAVESAAGIARTASVRFSHAEPATVADLRTGTIAGYPAGPFSTAISRPDLRRVDSERQPGAGNLSSVLVYLWRLRPDLAVNAPAARLARGRYSFDSLGNDIHLAVAPVARAWWAEPAGDIDLAAPLHRLPLARELADYYGPGRSVLVTIGDRPVPRHRVLVANLSRWPSRLPEGMLCLDPVLGRLAFDEREYPDDCPGEGSDDPPAQPPVRVNYARLVVGGLGAGHDHRPAPDRPSRLYRVAASGGSPYQTIGAALAAWVADRDDPATAEQAQHASIEIGDDDVYPENLAIDLQPGQWLYLCAAADRRPVIAGSGAGDELATLAVRGRRAAGSQSGPARLDLHGLYLHRTELNLSGQPLAVGLDRCTLAPVRGGGRRARYLPAICVRSPASRLRLAGCISGPIRIEFREAGQDPLPVELADSVLDAGAANEQALLGRERRPAYLRLDLQRGTVFGRLNVRAIAVVADSIITGLVESELRQHGEVHHSYLDPRSRTPRRSHCQPEQAIAEGAGGAAVPAFDSTSFGQPSYARLRSATGPLLLTGAADGGELGAFHDLWAGHRLAALQDRLAEFVPPGTDLDIRLAT